MEVSLNFQMIEEYKSEFSCPFLATKNGEITATLSEGVSGRLSGHVEI